MLVSQTVSIGDATIGIFSDQFLLNWVSKEISFLDAIVE
jgi:hypothetical protein